MGILGSSRHKQGLAAMTREEALACRPIRHPEVLEVERRETALVLSYPLQARPWAASLLRRAGLLSDRRVMRKLELDAMGMAVWEMVDARRTVAEIIRRFAERYQVLEREAELSVTQFLRALGRRGLIGFK